MNPMVASVAAVDGASSTNVVTHRSSLPAAANNIEPKKCDNGAAARGTAADATFGVGHIVYKRFNGI